MKRKRRQQKRSRPYKPGMFRARETPARVTPACESPVRSAQDYDSPDDALEGAASRIGAEWYVRDGDKVVVFMRSRDGYYKAELFKKGGWYHWPTDWPTEIRNLPIGARLVPNARAAEDGGGPIQDNPRGPRCGPDPVGGWKHRGGCCPGRPACRQQRKEEGLCYCAAYHYPHRSGSGRCGSPEEMDRHIYGPRRASKASEPQSFEVEPPIVPLAPAAPVAHEAAEQSAPSGEANAVPWVKIERDPKAYEAQIASAQAHGKITSARAVYDMLAPSLAKEDQETFLVIGVDVRGQCRGVVLVHKGARSRVSVDIPEILRTANALGGEMFIVVHNHPTTHATPSGADKSLTKAIEKAAKASEQVMMDHVIIGMGEYFSFAENKLTKVSGRERSTKSKRTRGAREEQPPAAEYVIAPQNTPQWLISKRPAYLWSKAYPAVEVDAPEEIEGWVGGGWGSASPTAFKDWADFRTDLFSSAPHTLTLPTMYREIRRGAADTVGPHLLGSIGIRHNGSPVWWTDLDHGPVVPASLYDLARHDQPYTIPRKDFRADVLDITRGETDKDVIKAHRKRIMQFAGRPLYLLSLQQWDDQEFPAPSQGGPPFIEHVSVGREKAS